MKRLGVIFLALFGVIAVVAAVDPMGPAGRFLPKCPVRTFAGIDCPGCGATRAIHQFFTGHPAEALACNYFLPLALVYMAVALVAELRPAWCGRVGRLALSPSAAYGFIALSVGWCIVRNLLSI